MTNFTVISRPETTVSVSRLTQKYIINAANTTYNYNLPSPSSCNGINFTFTRVDSTRGTVNINGSIYIGGTLTTQVRLRNFSTITIVSFGTAYYAVQNDISVNIGNNNYFSAFFIGNNGNSYITISPSSIFLYVPYAGTNNGVVISNILFTMGVTTSSATTITINSNIVIPVASGLNFLLYTLTSADKTHLPATINYLQFASGINAISISSILLYI